MRKFEIDLENKSVVVGDEVLTMSELLQLSEIYWNMSTAEYLFDNFDMIGTMSLAYNTATKIRYLMDKYNLTEDEAIEEYLEVLLL